MSGKNGLGAFLYVSVSALTALGIIYHAQIVQELVRHYEFAENLFPGSGDLSYTVNSSGEAVDDTGISLDESLSATGRGVSPESRAEEIDDEAVSGPGELPASGKDGSGSGTVQKPGELIAGGVSGTVGDGTGPQSPAGPEKAGAQSGSRPECAILHHGFSLTKGGSVLFIGDSLMHDLAPAAARELKAHGIRSVNASKSGTGLRTDTGREWKQHVTDILKRDDSIRLIVVMIGANDPVGFFEGRNVIKFGSPKWRDFYRGRIAEIYALAGKHGASVMWYALPAMKSSKYDAKARILTGLFSDEAEKRGGIMISAEAISPGGRYSAYLNDRGTMRQVRKDDGIHFTMYGAGLLARDFMARLVQLEEKGMAYAAAGCAAPGGKQEAAVLAENSAGKNGVKPETPGKPEKPVSAVNQHAGADGGPQQAAAPGDDGGADDDIEPAETSGEALAKTESSRGLIPEAGSDGLFEVMTNDRMLFVGDSLMQGIAPQIIKELDRRSIRYSNPSMKSTGLLVRKSCNWFEKTEQELSDDAAIRYMVVMLGLNDPLGFNVNGKPQAFGSEGWIRSYREFVDRIYAIADRHHVKVFWYKIPPVRSKTLDSKIPVLNGIFEEEAAARGGVFLEVAAMAPEGKYAAYIPFDGKSRKVRADDGIHFNVRGAGVMAAEFLRHLRFSGSERNLRFYDPGFARDSGTSPDGDRARDDKSALSREEKKSAPDSGRQPEPSAGPALPERKSGRSGDADGEGRTSGPAAPGKSASADSDSSAGSGRALRRTVFSDITYFSHVQTAGAKHV